MSHEQSSTTVGRPNGADPDVAARKRAAIELISRHGAALQRTARRYSLNAEDAEDAYQRSLEILLTKAPNDRINELVRWTHTVIKHEALAVRRKRERMMGSVPRPGGEDQREDWVAMIPSGADGPDVAAERGERIARSREALRALKPAELRALTLLAEGYSYAEIGELTGYSRTKVNRCLAEGRERFRKLVAGTEDGTRCADLRPLLSAFCDGEAGGEDAETVREHLRACSGCRATMRAYRATAGAAAALAPVFSTSRSLLEKVQELTAAVQSRLPTGGGGNADSTVAQVAAAGGTRGAGMAALAKLLTVCAGAAGGAAACVAAGVGPVPIVPEPAAKEPTIERVSTAAYEEPAGEPAPVAVPAPEGEAEPEPVQRESEPAPEPEPPPEPPPTEAGAVEYTAPPPPPPPPPSSSGGGSSESSGSAAGEFGP